ncbi:NAD(P)-binding domain protein [Ascosphaera apis ARSEF 7405]|uniref:NAD(P)-binding domain protein n=1 Tax=Ascosphaera apis ARSEF 7405 TaxID=392613 RepID=A0A167Z9A6_9EURO|nr:NAD(P)-binding domain protein [Ascosphaera apis ARSEF 7405]
MHVLRDSDVSAILKGLSREDGTRFLKLLWKTLASFSDEQTKPQEERSQVQPHRQEIRTSKGNVTLFMPSSDTETSTGIKVVTLPSKGPLKGTINVFSPEGSLDGLLNAEQITAFRTALASMIPFSIYPLTEGSHVVIFGAGKQAEWHARLALLLAHEKIKRVSFVNRSQKSLDAMADVVSELEAKFTSINFDTLSSEADDYSTKLQSVVGSSDAIFSCTPSLQPLYPFSYLGTKRRFISLIGSYRPHMHEIDTETLRTAKKVLVDSKDACLAESGELITANVQPEDLIEIGDMFDETIKDKVLSELEGGNVIFKCVGIGIMDLIMGRELLNLATENHLGINIDDF